jgi:hypothetical protein
MQQKLSKPISQTWVLVALLALSFFLFHQAEAAPQSDAQAATCKVSTSDIGTILARGKTKWDAFESAAEICYDRRAKLHRLKHGSDPDADTSELLIDTCANVKCS